MGMQPGAVSCPTYFNIEAYEGLPTEYRKLLDEAEATGYAALKAAYTAADDKNIPMFDEMGLERVVYTPAMRAEIEGKPRWDERGVGKASVSTCRSRWSPYHSQKSKLYELQHVQYSKSTETPKREN